MSATNAADPAANVVRGGQNGAELDGTQAGTLRRTLSEATRPSATRAETASLET